MKASPYLWAVGLLAIAVLITASDLFHALNLTVTLPPLAWTVDSGAVIEALTMAGIAFALYQIHMANRQIKVFTQTEQLGTMQAIIAKINDILPTARREIYFMANVPAIGATGAPDEFHQFGVTLTSSSRLGRKFHAIYARIDPSQIADGLEQFYSDRGITNPNDLKRILHHSLLLDQGLHEIDLLCKNRVQDIPLPHFILIDPDSSNRKAVIWNLDKSPNGGESGMIHGVGYYTTNPGIMNTHKHIFSDSKIQSRSLRTPK